jgi:hypothetical protein
MGQYERSGLTIQAFCDQEGLIAHQFSWWRSELKRRAAKSETTIASREPGRRSAPTKNRKQSKLAAGIFLPLQVDAPTSSSVEIVLDQPPRIKVSSGFDADLLREVVRVLESRQC